MADIVRSGPPEHVGQAGRKIRCAVYTRKSSEEGLEQSFNSLHAQREACEAYVTSQKHEGWSVLATAYDDGGFSGASMERPALKHLLIDIGSGKVDVVVVYKIDRLTRSLFDFAKIVEILDARKASFVSVTQSFNTTTSMGRLTLNVLLSFAQFEREVTGERIRDKIAASRAKGMFMGGNIPLGYDLKDHRLIPNEQEAKLVQAIFESYLRTGSVKRLKEELDREGAVTKRREKSGGKPFSPGHLYWILQNPVYPGQVRHRTSLHPGRHKAIIDKAIWQAVQEKLAGNRRRHKACVAARSANLLAGLIEDNQGNRYMPTHTMKGSKRYRYYARAANTEANTNSPIPQRLPAQRLDAAVIEAVCANLEDPARLVNLIGGNRLGPEMLASAIGEGKRLAERFRQEGWARYREIVTGFIRQVRLHPDRMAIELDRKALRQTLGIAPALVGREEIIASPTGEELATDRGVTKNNFAQGDDTGLHTSGYASAADGDQAVIEVPIAFADRQSHRRLVIASANGEPEPQRDEQMINAVKRARRWFDLILAGEAKSISDLAQTENTNRAWVSAQMSLAFLAPDIAEAVNEGRQPPAMTLRNLAAIAAASPDWAVQRGQFFGLRDSP